MIGLHVVNGILDTNALLANATNLTLINLVALVVLPFLGGVAGLFLLVSAISNMVSIYRRLERGQPTNTLIAQQVVSGVLLVLFGMLTEAVTGYNGSLGLFVRDLGGTYRWSLYLQTALWRWNWFEMIHTIGWCVILNGIIQGIVSRKEQWKNMSHLIRTYLILAVVMVALTIPVWVGVSQIVPGYPWQPTTTGGGEIYLPQIGVDSIGYLLASPFLAALAAPMGPVFPFLAVSCIGSIIGIVMCQPPERIPKQFVKKVLVGSLIALLVGMVGVVATAFDVFKGAGLTNTVTLWEDLSHFRNWFPDDISRVYGAFVSPLSWLWQFLALNGFAVMLAMIVIYLVDWRGYGPDFSKSRLIQFIRRFGFTAFSNYNNQWLYYMAWILVSILLTGQRRVKLDWNGTLLVMVVSYVAYYLVMRGWEKVRFIGSIEWLMGTIGAAITPLKWQPESLRGLKWYQKGLLDVKGDFYEVESVSVITPDSTYHAQLRDSRLIAKLSKISLFSVIFIPFTVVTLLLARDIQKKEGSNPMVNSAIRLSWIGVIITVAILLVCFFVTPKMLI
ncbi:MAG: hypothetical protein NTV61_10680 [Candidatus Bathyarchaeota archaeon]|nr:hypothetical protein [Candidatus Bathyarchaeota archaeon]